jgi:hypothetical protein
MDNQSEKGAGRDRKGASLAPTIDLSATEVATASTPDHHDKPVAEEATAAPSPPGGGSPDSAEPPSAPAEPPSADADEAAPPGATDEARTPKLDMFEEPPRDPPAFLPILAAALIGAAAGAAIVLAATLSGVVPGLRPADDNSAPRLAGIEQEVASTRQTVDQIVDRVAVVETVAKTASEAAGNALNVAEEAKGTAASRTAGTPDSALAERLSRAEGEAADLQSSLQSSLQASLAPVSDRASAAAATATKVETDLAAAQKRIADLEGAIQAGSPEKAAAYSVALSQLADAIRSGRPFEAELQAVRGLAADPKAFADLAATAPKGMPSINSLSRSYDAVAPSIEAALRPQDSLPANAGFLDRLWYRLFTVVSITREGEALPSDPAAPARAISAALRRGDLATAVETFQNMPEAARAAGATWFVEARAVSDALTLIRTETNAALLKLSQK